MDSDNEIEKAVLKDEIAKLKDTNAKLKAESDKIFAQNRRLHSLVYQINQEAIASEGQLNAVVKKAVSEHWQLMEMREQNPDGLDLVIRERVAHITREGWTPEHDATHNRGELALAGAAYAVADHATGYVVTVPWVWDREWWKPTTPIRNLTKAGALIVAEIDRRKAAGLL